MSFIHNYLKKVLGLDFHIQEILSGGILASFIKVIAILTNYLFTLVLAKYLGADGVGQFFLIFSIINISTIVGKFGIDQMFLRFIAPAAGQKDWGKVKGIYRKGSLIVFSISTVVAVIIFFSSGLIANIFFGRSELESLIRLFSFAIIPLAFLFNFTELFKAIKKIALCLSLKSIFLPGLTMLGILILPSSLGLKGVIGSYVAATIIIVLGSFFLWSRIINKNKEEVKPFATEALLDSSLPLFWVSLFQIVITWSSTLLMGIWETDASIGNFEIANRMAAILAPKIGILYSEKKIDTIRTICQRSTIIIVVLASPVFLIFLFFPEYILSFFGKDFTSGAVLLKIFLAGQFINVILGPVGFILLMCGREYLLRNAIIIAAVFIVTLNLILIPLIGVKGAAIAFSLTLILKNLIAAFYVKREFNIITLPFLGK